MERDENKAKFVEETEEERIERQKLIEERVARAKKLGGRPESVEEYVPPKKGTWNEKTIKALEEDGLKLDDNGNVVDINTGKITMKNGPVKTKGMSPKEQREESQKGKMAEKIKKKVKEERKEETNQLIDQILRDQIKEQRKYRIGMKEFMYLKFELDEMKIQLNSTITMQWFGQAYPQKLLMALHDIQVEKVIEKQRNLKELEEKFRKEFKFTENEIEQIIDGNYVKEVRN